jgi:hypothetical protein
MIRTIAVHGHTIPEFMNRVIDREGARKVVEERRMVEVEVDL